MNQPQRTASLVVPASLVAPASLMAPVTAVLLSLGAAAFLSVSDAVGILTDTTEALSTMSWLIGWMLLCWALILGGAQLIVLGRRAVRRRPIRPMYIALVTASLVLSTIAVVVFAPWGSGSASAL